MSPDPEHCQENLGKLLYAVRFSMIRKMEKAIADNNWDINFTQLRVLIQLGQHHSLSASELARAIEHNCGALTRVLDRLVEKGYVERSTNLADRRAVDLCLTSAGRSLWAAIDIKMDQLNADILSALNEGEQIQLFNLLHRVRSHLETSHCHD